MQRPSKNSNIFLGGRGVKLQGRWKDAYSCFTFNADGRTVKLQQLKKYENEYKIKKEDF
jgi:hypothetical protein